MHMLTKQCRPPPRWTMEISYLTCLKVLELNNWIKFSLVSRICSSFNVNMSCFQHRNHFSKWLLGLGICELCKFDKNEGFRKQVIRKSEIFPIKTYQQLVTILPKHFPILWNWANKHKQFETLTKKVGRMNYYTSR